MTTILIVGLAAAALASTVTAGVLLRQLGGREADLKMVLDALARTVEHLHEHGLIDESGTLVD
jgi:hypothetical protein